MKKVLVAVAAAALSLGALAFEKYMMRVPDELNPKEGINGVTTYFFAPAAVSIPLRDGTSVYVVNETHKLPSKDGTVQIGVPKKVVDLDVISRYRDAMKGFPSIAVQFGESTFFAYHCGAMFPAPDGLYVDNCYQGVVVSMGLEYSITVYLPKGRGLDAEVREVLKKIRFVPLPGVGVDTALKLYGERSAVPAAARLKTITKMVEERGECCELIELLSTLTGDAATSAWCMERLKFLNPGKYAPDARTEIAAYDSNNDAQQNAVMAMLGAKDKAEKASVKVPAASAEPGASSGAANKTKTITLPGGATMEFIWCEKGVFTMGQNDGEWDPSKDEEPRRKITLTKGFWLAKYETTQGQWKSVMGANPSHFKGDDALPVEMVSWKSCQEFAAKAGAALGVKLRLPTEAEWEYACRAGTRTTYYWGYQPSTAKANYDGTDSFHPERSLPTIGKTVKVGSYEPNAWGLYDMAGNVAEWCEDDWQENPSAENATDPLHRDGTQNLKVYRGGAWRGQNFTCRSAERSWFSSANERNWLGVRFVLEEGAAQNPATPAKPAPQPAEVAPQPAPQPAEVAPKPAEPAPQPKVAVKPGPGESEYKGRKWSYYIYDWGEVKIKGISDYSGVIEFPDRLGGSEVASIPRDLCKNRKEMTGVVLPKGIKTIEQDAFAHCTGLKELVLPEGLETIGVNAFVECTALEKVVLPKSLKTLANGAFFLCDKLTGDFDLRGLEKVEGWLFKGCPRINSVILPDSLTFLDSYMFESCSNLTKVTIPQSVRFIDSGVFFGCVSFKGEMEIPEGVTNIEYGAFRDCSGLTSIKIPSSVRKFGDSVFHGCSGVSRFDVPKDLDKISEFMFAGCTGLTAFDIPNGVKKIGAGAFSSCSNITEIALPPKLEKIENWAFKAAVKLRSIDVPEGVTQIDPYAFAVCVSLKKVTLHEGLKKIRKGSFRECTALEEIAIPASVESIEGEAFQDCSNLKKVVFLGKKPKIADDAFKNCPNLDPATLE